MPVLYPTWCSTMKVILRFCSGWLPATENGVITIEEEQLSPFSRISITQELHQHHSFEVVLPVDAFENVSRDILQQSKKYIGKTNFLFGLLR